MVRKYEQWYSIGPRSRPKADFGRRLVWIMTLTRSTFFPFPLPPATQNRSGWREYVRWGCLGWLKLPVFCFHFPYSDQCCFPPSAASAKKRLRPARFGPRRTVSHGLASSATPNHPDQRPFSLGLPANSTASRRGARQRWSGRYSARLAFLPLRLALGAAGILLEHLLCLALAFLLYPLPVPVRVLCDCDSECPSINPASKSFCWSSPSSPGLPQSFDPTVPKRQAGPWTNCKNNLENLPRSTARNASEWHCDAAQCPINQS